MYEDFTFFVKSFKVCLSIRGFIIKESESLVGFCKAQSLVTHMQTDTKKIFEGDSSDSYLLLQRAEMSLKK